MRIVFMGTPDFAVPCLSRLLEAGHDVAGVFSQPDRPKGRGHRLAPPPVKQLAEERGIPVYQPEKLRDGSAVSILKSISPQLIVAVAYGRILPRDILELPPLGCVNVHASLLPKLRGAAPVQWSVINGDDETGVTTMFMAEGLDTGDMILSLKTPIGAEETAGELFAKLAILGADALEATLLQLESGSFKRIKQDDRLATHAPMITKDMARLDFTRSPLELCNLIRGLNPAPGAFTNLEGKLVKVMAARPAAGNTGRPGEIIDPENLVAACGGGAIELVAVKPEGKGLMSGKDFARGKRLRRGEMLTSD